MSTITIGDCVVRQSPALRGKVVGLDGPVALVAPSHHPYARVVRIDVADLDPVGVEEGPEVPRAAMDYDALSREAVYFVAEMRRRGEYCTVERVTEWLTEAMGASKWIADHTVRLCIATGDLELYTFTESIHALRPTSQARGRKPS